MSRIFLQITKEGDTSLVRDGPSAASSSHTRISWELPAEEFKMKSTELLKYEDAQRVVVGVFSPGGGLSHSAVCQIFKRVCIGLLRQEANVRSGRVMCIEVNGTGKGCGIIAADNNIKIWMDQFD